MANLSKALFGTKLKTTVGGFDLLDEKLSRLEDAVDKLPESILKWTKQDALAISREMSTRFQNYIASLPSRERIDLPAITTYITEIRGGYNVAIAGKNIWYYEYGTGDQGEKSGYPFIFDIKRGTYVYNAGPKVIHSGELLDNPPAWYLGMITKDPAKASGNWWMSPHGPSNGIPAGKFFYTTVRDYRDGLTSDEEAMNWSLSKSSVHIKVRDGIINGKWR